MYIAGLSGEEDSASTKGVNLVLLALIVMGAGENCHQVARNTGPNPFLEILEDQNNHDTLNSEYSSSTLSGAATKQGGNSIAIRKHKKDKW